MRGMWNSFLMPERFGRLEPSSTRGGIDSGKKADRGFYDYHGDKPVPTR